MNCLHLLAIIYFVFTKYVLSTKWLIDNPGFNDPAAWDDDYLPCARELVVFPAKYQALLPLPQKVDVGGFVLPRDGAILLPQESTITLDGDSKDRDCDKGKGYLREPIVHKWFDPKTWRSSSGVETNKAVPDMEMVPCNNESVVIQSKGPVSFDLENIPYLRMGQLSFSGSLLSKNYLKQLLYTDLGQFIFKNQAGVDVEYYHNDVCGCHKDFNSFAEPICHNIVNTCQRPHCLVPVVPYGSCCAICGTVLKFQVEDCDNGKLHTLQNIIKSAIEHRDLEDDLDYYVNYESSRNYGTYLQAIIVDRNAYAEKSVRFVQLLNETTDWRSILNLETGHIFGIEVSGRPYNPNVSFGSVVLILLCIVFVSIVALVIFAHYKPDHHYLHHVPRWAYDPRLWRTFLNRSNPVFARFDNTRASVMTTEAGRSAGFTMGYDAESGHVRERAFDNPMFNEGVAAAATSSTSTSKGGEKSKVSSEPLKEVPQLVMESVDIVGTSSTGMEEEQELTEIKLESSSSESDESDDSDNDDGGIKLQESKE